ncbi:hypothetical protein N7492_003785 [Penicillium capsulatum]|uniref:HhH-GPD domain-containing protein n=1 Tax=Penicillium capsulatum TaxID=69766 RepID=A0A9W9IL85_9EURO|nr:hypothetical protein N7492_003785 [Penicillium capsulatum]KAJ6121632.1 hypothetical protein N7512_004097 [Penicillium capsulatum]
MTPCDEVKSKYFSVFEDTNAQPKLVQPHAHISEETQKILEEFNLPADFLSTDSELSDAASDLELDEPLHPIIKISPAKQSNCFSQRTTAAPETPVKSSHLQPEEPRTPRSRPPKTSPYFPKLLPDSDSCLPFPPIDAPTFGLVQEQLAHEPWKLLIATIFLNRTRGGVALPVLFKVFERYPTIHAMASADQSDLVDMIRCLGFQNQRANKCIKLAQTWQAIPPSKDKRYRKLHYPANLDGRDVGRDESIVDEDHRVAWEVAHLPGVGAYSLDSWRIFCRDKLRGLATDWLGSGASTPGFVPEWKSVLPQDKELRAYITWLWLKEGWVWDRHTGDLTPASDKMLRAAHAGGVAREEDGNWVLPMSPTKVPNGLHED